jgi:hypothetical protein
MSLPLIRMFLCRAMGHVGAAVDAAAQQVRKAAAETIDITIYVIDTC